MHEAYIQKSLAIEVSIGNKFYSFNLFGSPLIRRVQRRLIFSDREQA